MRTLGAPTTRIIATDRPGWPCQRQARGGCSRGSGIGLALAALGALGATLGGGGLAADTRRRRTGRHRRVGRGTWGWEMADRACASVGRRVGAFRRSSGPLPGLDSRLRAGGASLGGCLGGSVLCGGRQRGPQTRQRRPSTRAEHDTMQSTQARPAWRHSRARWRGLRRAQMRPHRGTARHSLLPGMFGGVSSLGEGSAGWWMAGARIDDSSAERCDRRCFTPPAMRRLVTRRKLVRSLSAPSSGWPRWVE